KEVTERQPSIKKALNDELAKNAIYMLEKSKQEKIGRQIAKCVLKAPVEGRVVRVKGPDGRRVEEGTTVRERQLLLRIVPDPAPEPGKLGDRPGSRGRETPRRRGPILPHFLPSRVNGSRNEPCNHAGGGRDVDRTGTIGRDPIAL